MLIDQQTHEAQMKPGAIRVIFLIFSKFEYFWHFLRFAKTKQHNISICISFSFQRSYLRLFKSDEMKENKMNSIKYERYKRIHTRRTPRDGMSMISIEYFVRKY